MTALVLVDMVIGATAFSAAGLFALVVLDHLRDSRPRRGRKARAPHPTDMVQTAF